jgi:tagatose 6-phosphate kinase
LKKVRWMILTITLNPAIDMSYHLSSFHINDVNRCNRVIKTAGGKGLNVSRVIRCTSERICATGFLGGTNGQFIRNELDSNQILHRFVEIKGDTRNCIALLYDGQQTEILEEGPAISEEEAKKFIENYQDLINDADVITASGSLPKGLKPSFYQTLIEIANKKGKKFILDTSGEALREGIKAKPYLIKPNLDELSQLCNRKVTTDEEVIEVIQNSLLEYEIEYIVVSLGQRGSIAYHQGVFYKITPPKVQSVNPIGSGDSMVAGFAVALHRNYSPEQVLVYGNAFGTLNAIEEMTGFIDTSQIDYIINQMIVDKIFPLSGKSIR